MDVLVKSVDGSFPELQLSTKNCSTGTKLHLKVFAQVLVALPSSEAKDYLEQEAMRAGGFLGAETRVPLKLIQQGKYIPNDESLLTECGIDEGSILFVLLKQPAKPKDEQGDACPICLTMFGIGSFMYVTDCSHSFCRQCASVPTYSCCVVLMELFVVNVRFPFVAFNSEERVPFVQTSRQKACSEQLSDLGAFRSDPSTKTFDLLKAWFSKLFFVHCVRLLHFRMQNTVSSMWTTSAKYLECGSLETSRCVNCTYQLQTTFIFLQRESKSSTETKSWTRKTFPQTFSQTQIQTRVRRSFYFKSLGTATKLCCRTGKAAMQPRLRRRRHTKKQKINLVPLHACSHEAVFNVFIRFPNVSQLALVETDWKSLTTKLLMRCSFVGRWSPFFAFPLGHWLVLLVLIAK